MKASEVVIIAWGLLILGHWSHNEKTLSVNQVVEMVFAILLISFLDQGKTEPIAKGLAWLFLISVLLGKNSILSALSPQGGLKLGSSNKKTKVV